jgi:hypothetical protein
VAASDFRARGHGEDHDLPMKELPHKAAQLRLSVGPPPCVFQHGGVEERAESTAFQAVVLSIGGQWRDTGQKRAQSGSLNGCH